MYLNLSPFISHLRRGGVVIYPTETAYALGCDAANQKAADLIFKIKKRPKSKTLPLIAGLLAMVKRYCRLSPTEEKLARKHWPGPVTMVLKRKEQRTDNSLKLAGAVAAKDGTVAIRVSSHPFARGLSRRLGRPIVSTSANISGKGECYSIGDVRKNIKGLKKREILIIDGGKLKKTKPSTIVKIAAGGIRILREGEIKIG